ncbi:hypothetical protein ASF98_10085 [Arthrobacter sp. Leaf337]|nr:hypothetical protein ASF98_10085 [Arthrobacter sp. Leaf337]
MRPHRAAATKGPGPPGPFWRARATGSYWPIAVYMMVIVGISLVQAIKAPETKDRDLTLEENAS